MCQTLCLCIWYSVDFFQQPSKGMFFYFPHFTDDTTRYREVTSTSSHRTERNCGSGMESGMSSGILSPELKFSSVQSLSHVWLFVTPWTAAHQASLSISNSRAYSNSCPSSLWCYPIISSSVIPFSSRLQSFPASGSFQMIQFFAIRWPKYWSFSFSISPSNEYSGLISFRMDWFELLAVQGTLKSLLQHHSSKASILQCSSFFMVQLSHLYMTTGKTIALTIRPLSTKWCLCFWCCSALS